MHWRYLNTVSLRWRRSCAYRSDSSKSSRAPSRAAPTVGGRTSDGGAHHAMAADEEGQAQAFAASEEKHENEVAVLKVEINRLRTEMEPLRLAYEQAKEQGERWRTELAAMQDRTKRLDSRCASVMSQAEAALVAQRALKSKEREWRRERAQLYQEVDKNTTSSILRREELYFTRTNMLKEVARLRGELEKKPLPEPEMPVAEPPYRGWPRGWELAPPPPGSPAATGRQPRDSPRQQRAYTPTSRPMQPPPSTLCKAWRRARRAHRSAAKPSRTSSSPSTARPPRCRVLGPQARQRTADAPDAAAGRPGAARRQGRGGGGRHAAATTLRLRASTTTRQR